MLSTSDSSMDVLFTITSSLKFTNEWIHCQVLIEAFIYLFTTKLTTIFFTVCNVLAQYVILQVNRLRLRSYSFCSHRTSRTLSIRDWTFKDRYLWSLIGWKSIIPQDFFSDILSSPDEIHFLHQIIHKKSINFRKHDA